MSRRRGLALAVGVVAGLGGGTPAAHAATAEVGTSSEAWYARVPSVEPRPPDTLHVGVLLGVEESRTYLVLDLAGVDADRVTGGTLRMPVDVAASRSPELSTVDVCLVGAPGAPVQGSTDEPPSVDCTTAAPASFDATAGDLVADLAPFASSLATTGLALVPRAPTPGPTNWHVALWSSSNHSTDARPIRAALTLTDPTAATAAPTASVAPTSTGSFGGDGTSFADLASGSSSDQLFSPAPPEAAPASPSLGLPDAGVVAIAPPRVGASPVSARSTSGTAPPNSLAFALPLLLLALAGYVGSVLTRPVLPAGRGRAPAGLPAAPPPAVDAPGPSSDG